MDQGKEKIAYLREQLNIAPDVIAVNNGSWGPLCQAALHKIADEYYKDSVLRRCESTDFMSVMHRCLNEDREELAKFFGCSTDEVALTESTTTGMNICLWGLNLEPGDEIISTQLENGAGFAVLNTIEARRKVTVKYADLGRVGEKDAVKAIEELITPKTKAVLVSHVIYVSGVSVDAKGICDLCRKHGIFTVFDGVQAAGTREIDVKGIGCDAYCIARHKFLGGPDGAGALYIRKESLPLVEPTISGVFTDQRHCREGYHPFDTAARFDVSTRPFHVQAGAAATMHWLRTEVGFDFMYERIGRLRNKLYDLLSEIENVELYSIRERSESSALILFRLKNMSQKELSEFLISKKIYNRPVEHYYPPKYLEEEKIYGVRLSISYWNTDEDVEKIAAAVKEAAEK